VRSLILIVLMVATFLASPPSTAAGRSGELTEGHLRARVTWHTDTAGRQGRPSTRAATSGASSSRTSRVQAPQCRPLDAQTRLGQQAGAQACLSSVLAGRLAARPGDANGPQAPVVVPPSRIAVEDAVSKALPTPVLGIDPRAEGLTGLESRLWYRDDGRSPLEPVGGRRGLSVTATAGPHTITARAWIVEYRWDMGDGSRYVTRAPGSPSNPAARHVYERKGNYTITVETVWAGEYTWQLEGTSGAGELGPVSRASTQSYGVVEVRSVLVG
jgi:hypothetical protein